MCLVHRSTPAPSHKSRALPQQHPLAVAWQREERVVCLWQGLQGWHSFQFCRRKSNCVWVWALVFNGIAIFLEIFVSLMLIWRSSVSPLGWVFKKIGACHEWMRVCVGEPSQKGSGGVSLLIGTCLCNRLIEECKYYLQAVTLCEHILRFLEKSANSVSKTFGSWKLDIAIYYSWLGIKSVIQYSMSIAKIWGGGGEGRIVPFWIHSPCLKNTLFLYCHLKTKNKWPGDPSQSNR